MMRSVDKDNFDVEVVQSHIPVLVDVWGPQCVPCLRLMPQVEKLEEEYGDALKIVKLNSSENRRLCIQYRIMSLPTFVLFVAGEEVDRVSGQDTEINDVKDLIGKVSSDPRVG